MPTLVRRAGPSGLSDRLIGLDFTRGGFHQTAYECLVAGLGKCILLPRRTDKRRLDPASYLFS